MIHGLVVAAATSVVSPSNQTGAKKKHRFKHLIRVWCRTETQRHKTVEAPPVLVRQHLPAESDPQPLFCSLTYVPPLCPTLCLFHLTHSLSLRGGKKKKKKLLPAPFVQLADWIETPGKISEMQHQCRELNRAGSQMGSEGSSEERGSDVCLTLLLTCNKASSSQLPLRLLFFFEHLRRRAHQKLFMCPTLHKELLSTSGTWDHYTSFFFLFFFIMVPRFYFWNAAGHVSVCCQNTVIVILIAELAEQVSFSCSLQQLQLRITE